MQADRVDLATYLSPQQCPVGIPDVISDGELVIRQDSLISARPGSI